MPNLLRDFSVDEYFNRKYYIESFQQFKTTYIHYPLTGSYEGVGFYDEFGNFLAEPEDRITSYLEHENKVLISAKYTRNNGKKVSDNLDRVLKVWNERKPSKNMFQVKY